MAKKLPTLVIEKDQKPPKLGQCYRAFLYFNGYWKLNKDYTYLIEMYSSANHRIDITSEGAARFMDMVQGYYYVENLQVNDGMTATLLPDAKGFFRIYKIEVEKNCQIVPNSITGRSLNEPKIMPLTINLSTLKLSNAYQKMINLQSHIEQIMKNIEKFDNLLVHQSHLSVEIFERIKVSFTFLTIFSTFYQKQPVFRPKFGKDHTKPDSWIALHFSEDDQTDQSEHLSELEAAQDEIENHQHSKKRKYKRVYIESSDDDNVSILSEPTKRKNKAKKRKYSSQKMVSDSSSDNCESPRSQSKEFNFFIYEPIILGRLRE